MKVALTGACGHIGISIMDELKKRGHTIKALAFNDTAYLEARGIEYIKGDMNEETDLEQLMDGCDALIHSAGIISINGDKNGTVRKVNVEGVKKIMQTALNKKIKRVVHISSVHAYNPLPNNEILDENRDYVNNGASSYDQSKRDGELIVKEMAKNGLPAIVINPTSVTGAPENKLSYQGKAILDIYSGKIPAIFNGGFDWVDVRDVSNSICNALTMGRVGESYLLSGKYYSMRDIINMISEIKGEQIKIPTIPSWVAKAGLPFIKIQSKVTRKEPLYTNESIEVLLNANQKISSLKAKQELQHNPREFKETVRDLIQWFKENGYIKQ